jgi:hypothetical protein
MDSDSNTDGWVGMLSRCRSSHLLAVRIRLLAQERYSLVHGQDASKTGQNLNPVSECNSRIDSCPDC